MFVWPTSHMGMMHPGADQRARNMAQDFVTYAEASRAGVTYNEAKKLLSVSTNQAETRKSFYEELALLYVPYRSNKIVLTPLGDQLFDLLAGKDLSNLPQEVTRQATALIIWAMCRSQINRPQSRGVPRPSEAQWRSCDIRPYAAAWMAVGDLGGELALHEFMGALRRLHKATDYDSVIERILAARKSQSILAKSVELTGSADMNYRIYWKSHLSVAEQVLNWDESASSLRVNAANWDIVGAALRFQAGCEASTQRAIQSSSWTDANDYFLSVAGAACPPFLATGTPKVTVYEGQAIADLRAFDIINEGGHYSMAGGPELCELALRMPCFHPSSPGRLLRIDAKEQRTGGTIALKLGLGRPIVNLSVLQAVLEAENAG